MKYCSDCNIEYSDSAYFCENCGKPLLDRELLSERLAPIKINHKSDKRKHGLHDIPIKYEIMAIIFVFIILISAILAFRSPINHSTITKTNENQISDFPNPGDSKPIPFITSVVPKQINQTEYNKEVIDNKIPAKTIYGFTINVSFVVYNTYQTYESVSPYGLPCVFDTKVLNPNWEVASIVHHCVWYSYNYTYEPEVYNFAFYSEMILKNNETISNYPADITMYAYCGRLMSPFYSFQIKNNS